MSNENYKAQLDQRPPLEAYQKIQREYKNLDLLLQGTQRENEKCMADLERQVKIAVVSWIILIKTQFFTLSE